MKDLLAIRGCSRCHLGEQEELKGPVVWRGNKEADIVLLGEGPGLVEDQEQEPFRGPAGILLDRILASVGMSTEEEDGDFYIGNVVKCRPIASPGTGKQNTTPTAECIQACSPYWKRELELLNPKLVVLCGKTAAQTVLERKEPMKYLVGKFYDTKYFVMYHPAALLHAQQWPDKYDDLRKQTWTHAKQIRNFWDKEIIGRDVTYPEVE